MTRAIIVHNTRKGATAAIGKLIADGLSKSGIAVDVKDAAEIQNESDLTGYDVYVFGSATYHGEMLQLMKRILFLAEKAKLRGKRGGAFGAFGWSGEAPDRIFNTMLHILGMDMVSGPLRVKSAEAPDDRAKALEYGALIARRLQE